MNQILFPEFLLAGLALVLLLIQSLCKTDARRMAFLAKYGVLLVFFLSVYVPLTKGNYWDGLYVCDSLSVYFKSLFLLTLFFVLWMGETHVEKFPLARSEFFIFPLFATIGMMFIASATDFILLFAALELITITFYVLVAYARNKKESLEAGVKYLVLGGVSTAFLVYGLAFVFGSFGTTSYQLIQQKLIMMDLHGGVYFAILLVTIGLGFKLAAVPFHSWAPDVYEGAPTSVTAFLAIGSKAAGLVAMIRLFYMDCFAVGAIQEFCGTLFAALAILSLVYGSLAALHQRNVKRLMGYSSISHAGFIMMGFTGMGLAHTTIMGVSALTLYITVYMLASLLIFFIICSISEQLGGENLSHFSGLSEKSPLAAFALTISFVSLAGIPPLIGFLGKLGVFAIAWKAGQLAVVCTGVVAAVVGLYYYIAIVRYTYWMAPMRDSEVVELSKGSKLVIYLLVLAIIGLGLWSTPLAELTQAVADSKAYTLNSIFSLR